MNNFVCEIPPKVYFGENQPCRLGGEVKALGERVLPVYGISVKKTGFYDRDARLCKACGGGAIHGFKTLTPEDAEAVLKMRL